MTHYRHSIRYAILFITFCATGSSVAGEIIDQSLKVPDSGILFIDNTRGLVTVHGWDKTEVLLQGELDDSARKLVFKNKGHKTLIKVVMEGMTHHGDNSNLKIFMPKNLKLRFKGVDATFKLNDLRRGVEGRTINGDLIADNVHGKIVMSSVSGNIKLSKSSGHVRLESVSGKVDYAGEFSEAKIKSMTGNILADISKTNSLRVTNVSGDTMINGHLQNKADVELSSVSGDIRYTVQGELNANCDIGSLFGGKIINFLTEDHAWSERKEERKLSFVSGDGSGTLVMNTVSGSVTLDK